MSSPYRRARGAPKVQLNMHVAPEIKQLIDQYASRANCPIWAVIEAAIRAGVPGEDGLPENWDIYNPDQESLEIEEAVKRTA